MGLASYVRTGTDPAAVAVMFEDGAAVAGLAIAGTCLALAQVTRQPYDLRPARSQPACGVVRAYVFAGHWVWRSGFASHEQALGG